MKLMREDKQATKQREAEALILFLCLNGGVVCLVLDLKICEGVESLPEGACQWTTEPSEFTDTKTCFVLLWTAGRHLFKKVILLQ